MTNFKGTGVALITPFNNDNTIDYLSIDKLLNHVINGGVNYVVLLGTTGESVTLSLKEKNKIINFSKKIINNMRQLDQNLESKSCLMCNYH